MTDSSRYLGPGKCSDYLLQEKGISLEGKHQASRIAREAEVKETVAKRIDFSAHCYRKRKISRASYSNYPDLKSTFA
jgi:hypothetical protein